VRGRGAEAQRSEFPGRRFAGSRSAQPRPPVARERVVLAQSIWAAQERLRCARIEIGLDVVDRSSDPKRKTEAAEKGRMQKNAERTGSSAREGTDRASWAVEAMDESCQAGPFVPEAATVRSMWPRQYLTIGAAPRLIGFNVCASKHFDVVRFVSPLERRRVCQREGDRGKRTFRDVEGRSFDGETTSSSWAVASQRQGGCGQPALSAGGLPGDRSRRLRSARRPTAGPFGRASRAASIAP